MDTYIHFIEHNLTNTQNSIRFAGCNEIQNLPPDEKDRWAVTYTTLQTNGNTVLSLSTFHLKMGDPDCISSFTPNAILCRCSMG